MNGLSGTDNICNVINEIFNKMSRVFIMVYFLLSGGHKCNVINPNEGQLIKMDFPRGNICYALAYFILLIKCANK